MRICCLMFCVMALSVQSAGAETCRVASRSSSAVAFQSGLTIAPFAIPVAVPVATISQPAVFYGYAQYRTAPSTAMQPIEPPRPARSAPTMIEQRCAGCHSGPNPKGGVSLGAAISELPREQRLSILERVTSSDPQRRMPLGEPPLTPDELRTVLQELVR
jgi:hypothetical protein